MKFSIITICYNPGQELKSAVDSVFCQQGVDIEYIIIDGGSTDGTVEYVSSLNGKVAHFVSEPDGGLYHALNKGIQRASGDVIGFVHADDILAGDMVLSDVAAMFKKGDIDAVYGDLVYVAKDNPKKIIRYWRSGRYSAKRLRFGWMPPHPALYIRREIYERARLGSGEYFDTSLSIASDYDFMMRLLGKLQIRVAYLPQVLVNMRAGGASNKNLPNIIQKSREDYIAIKRNEIGGIGTLICKNLRKLPQFFIRR